LKRDGSTATARVRTLVAFLKRHSVPPFNDLSLLEQAFTHSSVLNESGAREDNQRLEYLGDSVVGLIVNEHLYRSYPELSEGEMARIKSYVVSEKNLSKIALQQKIGELVLLGKGELMSGGRKRPSILADTLEAVIGAVFLDQGLVIARRFVLKLLTPSIRGARKPSTVRDAKSRFQEIVQQKLNQIPVYEVVKESGPKHERQFVCAVRVDGEVVASGEGASKKSAEQRAAARALKGWRG